MTAWGVTTGFVGGVQAAKVCSRSTGRGNWSLVGCRTGLASGDPGDRTAIAPVCHPVRFHSVGRGRNRPLAGLGHALLQPGHYVQGKPLARWRAQH
ncbi:MAG: hypothetical protein ACRDBQ_06245 [Shewanella sp.]